MLVVGPDDDFRQKPDTFAPVLRRNTALPAERTQEFYTMLDNQKHLEVEVFQGESPAASENLRVGSFGFDLKPVPAQSPVRVAFAYDLNGVVKISISQPGLENTKTVAMSVADASKASRSADVVSVPASAVERKARELLEQLEGGQRKALQGLLEKYLSVSGAAKEAAEEDLLDFFLQHASDEDSDEEDLFEE
jgi:molecular chaperone DnaK